MSNLKRRNPALFKILTVFLLTVIIIGSAIALHANANSADTSIGGIPTLTLVDARIQEQDSITAFNSNSNLIFTVLYNYPIVGDSIVINLDEKVFVRNTDTTLGTPVTANVDFSDDGRTMKISAAATQNKYGYFQVVVPFVYNQLETRLSGESQFITRSLLFSSDRGESFEVPVTVERTIYDMNTSFHDPYIKISPEKLYYTNEGDFKVTMNAFYNYGKVQFEDNRPVTVSNDWAKNVFYLDRESLAVYHVNTPVNADGAMNIAPNNFEMTQIYKYGDYSGAKGQLQANFKFANTYGFSMSSATKNAYYGGYSGGFKGSAVSGRDSLLIKYTLAPYRSYWNEATSVYTINSAVAGSIQDPFIDGTPVKEYIEIKNTATFKYPVSAYGRDSDTPY